MSLTRATTLVSMVLVLIATLLGVTPQRAAADTEQAYTLSNTRYYEVQYTHTLENTSDATVSRQDLWCPVPADGVNQSVSDLIFSPQPAEFLVDGWGQRVAHYVVANMPGKSTREIGWTARLEISDVAFCVDPGMRLSDVPADIIQTYTADDEKYVLTSPVVQQAAADAVGAETSLYGKVAGIYRYVIDHLYYLKEGSWDDAPTVLTRGNGSCSEYAYVTVALCRANGIPARLVGGSRNRDGGNYVDTVFHRAAEVYLPGYGWVPIDTDLGETAGRPIFTRYGDHFIFQASGGRSSLLRWDYRSRFSVADLTLVTRAFQWAVIEPNNPPVLNAIGNKSVNEGATLSFTVTASDSDGDALTYSASNLPEGAAFNAASRTFSWTPTYGQAGIYAGVRFQVSDGQSTDSEDMTITVTSVMPADVNGDGSVNVADITFLERIIAGLEDTTPGADANGDGSVNVADITRIERIIAGLS